MCSPQVFGISRNVSKDERIELDVVAESLDKKYLLVDECKWTSGENSNRLLAGLKTKAQKLPFAKNRTIIPKLFLKSIPTGTMENVLLPEDIIKLQKTVQMVRKAKKKTKTISNQQHQNLL
jgi:hypothetical protein